VANTANGESPLVHGAQPILGCDVWEHSYYIDYRNRRPDYLKAFVNHLINWDHVAEMFGCTKITIRSSTPFGTILKSAKTLTFVMAAPKRLPAPSISPSSRRKALSFSRGQHPTPLSPSAPICWRWRRISSTWCCRACQDRDQPDLSVEGGGAGASRPGFAQNRRLDGFHGSARRGRWQALIEEGSITVTAMDCCRRKTYLVLGCSWPTDRTQACSNLIDLGARPCGAIRETHSQGSPPQAGAPAPAMNVRQLRGQRSSAAFSA
jgi:iron/manganese superoxide dismutase-like protein